MSVSLPILRPVLLFVSGALLVVIGSFIVAAPAGFYAANGIELGTNVSLLNELKAPAGVLLVAGLFMIIAVFVRRFTDAATGLAALIYLSYAASRFTSMVVDGLPADGLVQAAALEALIGFACLTMLLPRRILAGVLARVPVRGAA